jgi:uncharacterized protein
MPCLATRIAYGERITPHKLKTIARAEEFIRGLGFPEVRVRMHEGIARIEVPAEKISELARCRAKISKRMKALGFVYAAIDCDGFRSGSMNEALGWKREK